MQAQAAQGSRKAVSVGEIGQQETGVQVCEVLQVAAKTFFFSTPNELEWEALKDSEQRSDRS